MRLSASVSMRYFRRYLERTMKENHRRTWNPIVGWKEAGRKKWNYGEHRPWTENFKMDNLPHKGIAHIPVEPLKEWNIFIGDRVKILVGKDKGKVGIVNSIIKERNWVYVEGLNCEYVNAETEGQETVLKTEKPLLVTSQVALVDPSNNESTAIEWRFTEDGEKVRVSERSGRIVPLPSGFHTLEDHVNPQQYNMSEKDTPEDDALEVTFQAKLTTFEGDIDQQMDFKDPRKRAKTYWY